jgi:hypothetical protein
MDAAAAARTRHQQALRPPALGAPRPHIRRGTERPAQGVARVIHVRPAAPLLRAALAVSSCCVVLRWRQHRATIQLVVGDGPAQRGQVSTDLVPLPCAEAMGMQGAAGQACQLGVSVGRGGRVS